MIRYLKFYCLLAFFNSASVFASPSLHIDVEAAERFASLIILPDDELLSSIQDKYIDIDEGGLAILKGRYRSAVQIFNSYTSNTVDYQNGISTCLPILKKVGPKIDHVLPQLQSLLGIKVNSITVYAVFGAGNTAATADKRGIVLSLEALCKGLNTNNAENVITNFITHEAVHVQQHRLSNRKKLDFTLLEISLLEGTADYIAELLLGDAYILNDERQGYADKRLEPLLELFYRDMRTKTYSPWLYTPNDTMPSDMGYELGARLAQNYIKTGGNFPELLRLSDAEKILPN